MKAFKYFSNLLVVLAISIIGHIILSDFESFKKIIQSVDSKTFGSAVIIAITLNISTAYLYTRILNTGNQATTDISIFFISQMMKYIPGKIWTVSHQKAFYGKKKSTLSIIRANLTLTYYQVTLCTIIAISIIALYLSPLITALILCLSVGLLSSIKSKPLEFLTKALKISPQKLQEIDTTLNSSFLLLYSATFIILYISSHILLVSSIITTTLYESLLIVGTLCAAWVAGLFFIFTPAGIGAREGLIILILSTMNLKINVESFAAIAISTRVWMLVVDIIPGLASLIYLKRKK